MPRWSHHLCSCTWGWWLLQITYTLSLQVNNIRLEHSWTLDSSAGVAIIWLLFVCCSVGGSPHQLVLKLPVFINKFIEETVMGSADFFSRWKQLAKYEPFRKHTPSLPLSLSLSPSLPLSPSLAHYALKIAHTQ